MFGFRLTVAVLVGRAVSFVSRVAGLGMGGTWSGHLALKIDPQLIRKLEDRINWGSMVVVGTNGKTTTCKMIREMLEAQGLTVVHNETGANLLNGVAGALVQVRKIGSDPLENNGSLRDPAPVGRNGVRPSIAVFEIDENVLPLALDTFTPEVVVILNLFRDQLDRYAELEIVADKWRKALGKLPRSSVVVLNADDPLVASLGADLSCRVLYFGLGENSCSPFAGDSNHTERGLEVGRSWGTADSERCPKCDESLVYSPRFYSHLGNWECPKGDLRRPELDLIAADIKSTPEGWSFTVSKPSSVQFGRSDLDRERSDLKLSLAFKLPLAGLFSVHNALGAVGAVFASRNSEGKIGSDPSEDSGSQRDPALDGQDGVRPLTDLLREVLENFEPAFGRQEEFSIGGKTVKVLLSKNPTGMNENLRMLLRRKAEGPFLFVLNDRIPDGRDTSWVWDIDGGLLREVLGKIGSDPLENSGSLRDPAPVGRNGVRPYFAGDRAEDMALRVKYAVGEDIGSDPMTDGSPVETRPERQQRVGPYILRPLKKAIREALAATPEGGTLYVLPTYSGMLEVRRELMLLTQSRAKLLPTGWGDKGR